MGWWMICWKRFMGKRGYDPENIDQVVAHEIGHVAGAPDEYLGACKATDTFGPSNVPDGNCQTDQNVPASPCLMFSLIPDITPTMCQFTPNIGAGSADLDQISGLVPTVRDGVTNAYAGCDTHADAHDDDGHQLPYR